MSTLVNYWPSQAHVDQCIRTEAETVDDAVLLAVHQSGPLLVRSAQTGKDESRNEQQLLEALLRPASDGSAVVVAITGASGVGKSHMVRWLHAQLQRHPDRNRWVIVLIPKTASLRQVVERILAPLRGAAYDALKVELSKSIENLTPDSASELLATALAIELERCGTEWAEALRASGNNSDRHARERVFHAIGLRGMLRDGTVFDQWFGKAVLHRIVTQTLGGGSEAESGTLRRFTPTDFQVPEGCDMSQAALSAQRYLARLQSNDGAELEVAATVLQEVLDAALRTVFRFSEALGQRTIEEIVEEIRIQLLGENKELVLLIEDFAALAGIQQPLLNLMIAESDHLGHRVRAPLRTALAVTDGFLPSRQTILTRAKQEWIIPSAGGSEPELLQRLTDLAGRYLNAARFGVDVLREHYARHSHKDSLYGWVQRFEVDHSSQVADQLKTFGFSAQGYPLFPLSPLSIASLCRRELTSAGQLAFNPRAFINHVLRDTLSMRHLFEIGSFPPAAYKDSFLAAETELALHSQPHPEVTKARLATVLVHWAGNPPNLQAPPLVDRGVFEAFHLPWPYSAHSAPRVAEPPSTGLKHAVPSPQPAPPPLIGGTKGLAEELEAWAKGSLSEKTARHFRTLVALALADRLDWNSLRLRRAPIPLGWIWLPFVAVGNPTTEPKLVVADEVRPVSALARLGLKALDRWAANGRNWNYDTAEEDYVVAQLLLDRLQPQAETWFLNSARQQLAVASRTIHRQSLLLGLSRKPEPALVRANEFWAEAPVVPPAVVGSDGIKSPALLIAAVRDRARASRPHLHKLLLDGAGCYRGTRSTLYALDPIRLQSAWKDKESDRDFACIRAEGEIAVRESAQELGMARLPALVARYRTAVESAAPHVQTAMGVDFQPGSWSSVMSQVLSTARLVSVLAGGTDMAQIERSIKSLASKEMAALIRRFTTFTAPKADQSVDIQLAAWTAIDVVLLGKAVDDIKTLELFLRSIDRETDAALAASGGADTVKMLAELQARLSTEGA